VRQLGLHAVYGKAVYSADWKSRPSFYGGEYNLYLDANKLQKRHITQDERND